MKQVASCRLLVAGAMPQLQTKNYKLQTNSLLASREFLQHSTNAQHNGQA